MRFVLRKYEENLCHSLCYELVIFPTSKYNGCFCSHVEIFTDEISVFDASVSFLKYISVHTDQ